MAFDSVLLRRTVLTFARRNDEKSQIPVLSNTAVYGPRMRLKDGRVVPAFISQALNQEPVTVFGDGSQTRSFCYVSDLIDGIFRLAMSEYHEPVNIGNPREMTILEFANKILEITGSKSEIIKKPLPEDDPKLRRPDITRARQLLCWEPKVDFESGIRETISYFKVRKAA